MTAASNTVTSKEVTVFISYSWDSEEHKKWALAFATQLRKDGINAIIDEMHLPIGGRSPEFMERSIRESEFVLVICTENYKRKFDNREGGAGYEGHIMTGEVIARIGENKFIPVLRTGDWKSAVPSALSGIRGVDLRSDSLDEYQSLVRRLYGLPVIPPIGSRPAWVGDATAAPIAKEPGVNSSEFLKQRAKLPETEILRKIWSRPHWKIWIRPSDFKRARFRNLEQCRAFILSSYVLVHGWLPYPWFSADTLETGDEWVAGEIDESGRTERWAMFRSAQFVHSRAFDDVPRVTDGLHVLEVLDTVTGAIEFAARMAEVDMLWPSAEITFELYKVDGMVLTWPQDMFGNRDLVGPNRWCEVDSIRVQKSVAPNELEAGRRQIALELALEIFGYFGWADPPQSRLASEQEKRFG